MVLGMTKLEKLFPCIDWNYAGNQHISFCLHINFNFFNSFIAQAGDIESITKPQL